MLENFQRRNRDFMRAVRHIAVKPSSRGKSISEIVAIAAASPAPGYYVSVNYMIDRLGRERLRHKPRKESSYRRKMWEEIDRKVRQMRARGMTRTEAVCRLLTECQASSFFMSPSTARSLYFNILKNDRYINRQRRHARACNVGPERGA